jgi:hypothetical protein
LAVPLPPVAKESVLRSIGDPKASARTGTAIPAEVPPSTVILAGHWDPNCKGGGPTTMGCATILAEAELTPKARQNIITPIIDELRISIILRHSRATARS